MARSSRPAPRRLVVTCEHASNAIPGLYRAAVGAVGDGHDAWDPGAARLARTIAAAFAAPLVLGTVSRQLLDLNRSPDNPRRWSTRARRLSAPIRARIQAQYHDAHWAKVQALVDDPHAVLHIGVHSFTPRLRGRERAMDIGLLYDPARPAERQMARAWRESLETAAPSLRIRRNEPYRGTADGLTRALRLRTNDRDYAGLELEVSQRLLIGGQFPTGLANALVASLRKLVRVQ